MTTAARSSAELHDGVQQHLVALAVNLQLAERLVDDDPVAAKALLHEMPFDHDELLARVRSLLRIKRYHDEIAELNRTLEERVQKQAEELEHRPAPQRFLPPQLEEMMVSPGDASILAIQRRQVAML